MLMKYLICMALFLVGTVHCEDEFVMFCKDKVCPEGTRCEEVSSGCEDVPEDVACDPMIEAKCLPESKCPNVPCGIRCQYGLAYDENGCQLCQCLPNPCATVLCLTGTTCVVVPNDECDGDVKCPPFKAVCNKTCTMRFRCLIVCRFGAISGADGCPTCGCKPDPCLSTTCPENHICKAKQTDNCKKPPCPYVGTCVYNCPMYKCMSCTSGYVVDKNGCQTCRCKDPCERADCNTDETCEPDPSSAEGYKCVPAQ